jgi:hypothetical protein
VVLEDEDRQRVDAARSAAVCWRMSTQYSSRSIIRAMPRTWPSIRDRRRTRLALSFE